MQVIPAGNAPCITLVSCSNGRHHGLDAKDVEGPAQIVDERREAELSPDIVEALHQKGALVHPLLDAAEGMLDEFATPVEDSRPRLQAGGHPVEHRLVLQTRDPATVCGTPRPKTLYSALAEDDAMQIKDHVRERLTDPKLAHCQYYCEDEIIDRLADLIASPPSSLAAGFNSSKQSGLFTAP